MDMLFYIYYFYLFMDFSHFSSTWCVKSRGCKRNQFHILWTLNIRPSLNVMMMSCKLLIPKSLFNKERSSCTFVAIWKKMKTSTADYLRIVALNVINYISFCFQIQQQELDLKRCLDGREIYLIRELTSRTVVNSWLVLVFCFFVCYAKTTDKKKIIDSFVSCEK